MSLFGLQSFSHDVPEVSALLTALEPHVGPRSDTGQAKGTKVNIAPEEFASAMYGLQSMDASSAAVRPLVISLGRLLSASSDCTARFTSKHFGMIMYGLKSTTQSDTVGKLLLIYICNFHVLSHFLLIFICKLHWNMLQQACWIFLLREFPRAVCWITTHWRMQYLAYRR